MIDFVPERVKSQKDQDKEFELEKRQDEIYLILCYRTVLHNHTGAVGFKYYNLIIPKTVTRNPFTFEVLGLLQAEMGKQQDGKVVFCNHEYKLVNKVLLWFESELALPKDKWKWYIKVNINEPSNNCYKEIIEKKTIDHWTHRTGLSLQNAYPKTVSYIKNTKNQTLRNSDYGTLIIENANNLFSQIVKNFVNKMSRSMLSYHTDELRHYMRGIIAGESNVECNKNEGHFRVMICAKDLGERLLYKEYLNRLGIDSTVYNKFLSLVISKKDNILELLKQKMMTLSPEKYSKFLNMAKLYKNFDELKLWEEKLQKPHNKKPDWLINEVIELHFSEPNAPAWKLAEQLQGLVSDIFVQRTRKQLNLSKSKAST